MEQMVNLPTYDKKTMDLILTSQPGDFLQTNSVIMICVGHKKKRNLGEKSIYTRKLIMKLWGEMHLKLQGKTLVTRILVRYRKSLWDWSSNLQIRKSYRKRRSVPWVTKVNKKKKKEKKKARNRIYAKAKNTKKKQT